MAVGRNHLLSADLGLIAFPCKVAPTDPPLDGSSVKGQDHAIQTDDESALRNTQHLRNFSRSRLGNYALAPFAQQNAEAAREQTNPLGNTLLMLQPWEQRGWY